VNLIQPGTVYGPTRNNFDLRVSKILKFGPTRWATISLDVYNLRNSDIVLAFNNSFVPDGAWLTPTRIAPARYMRSAGNSTSRSEITRPACDRLGKEVDDSAP
jgi:hypothetical protein